MTDNINKRQNNTFGVEFSTKRQPGFIAYTKVTIEEDVLAPDDIETVDVSLAEHPLYKNLWEYCRDNPPRK